MTRVRLIVGLTVLIAVVAGARPLRRRPRHAAGALHG